MLPAVLFFYNFNPTNMHVDVNELIFWASPYFEIRPKSPVNQNNLVLFPCEYMYTHFSNSMYKTVNHSLMHK